MPAYYSYYSSFSTYDPPISSSQPHHVRAYYRYNRWLSLNHPDNPLNPILSQQPHEDDTQEVHIPWRTHVAH